MIFRYCLLFLSLYLCACTSQKEDAHFSKREIKAAAFKTVPADSLQKLLVEQFCEESKGYQENTWLGLNRCIWAIEKFRLGQYPELIQRTDHQLRIQLANGKQKVFLHRDLDTDTPTYFQFKRYLPKNGLILLERMSNEVCTQHLFVRLSDGKQTSVSGMPYLGRQERGFILNGGTDTCRSTLEYWTIQEGQIRKQWSEPLGTGKIEELRWVDAGEFVVRTESSYARYKLH